MITRRTSTSKGNDTIEEEIITHVVMKSTYRSRGEMKKKKHVFRGLATSVFFCFIAQVQYRISSGTVIPYFDGNVSS